MSGYKKLYLVDSILYNKLSKNDVSKSDSVSETKETESKTKITKYNSGVMQTKITEPYTNSEVTHIPSPPKTAFVDTNTEDHTRTEDDDYEEQMEEYRERLRKLKDDNISTEAVDSNDMQVDFTPSTKSTQTSLPTSSIKSTQTSLPSNTSIYTQTQLSPEIKETQTEIPLINKEHQSNEYCSSSIL